VAPLVGVCSRASGDWLGDPASSDSETRVRVRAGGWPAGPICRRTNEVEGGSRGC
jgi:hypothetical protein